MKCIRQLLILIGILGIQIFLLAQAGMDTIRSNQNYQRQGSFYSGDVKVGRNYHYVGFQANQILRQLLGGAGSADNPYLFNYSFNSVDNGNGMNFGLGFNFSTTDDSDPTINLKRTTKSNNTAIRVGYDKKKAIGKRWVVGFGIDLIKTGSKSETKTTFSGGGGPFSNNVSTKGNGFGIGPRLSLLFNVHEKIYLGTETTMYFMYEKITGSGDLNSPTSLDQETKTKSFKLGAPSALFIMVRF